MAWKPQLDGIVDLSMLDSDAEENAGLTPSADFEFDPDEVGFDFAPADEDAEWADSAASHTERDVEAESDANTDVDEEEPVPGEGPSFRTLSFQEAQALEPGATIDSTGRALFERELKPLEVDARVEMARNAANEHLRALCFDPSPRVIAALLENLQFGLEHARQVASHHRSGAGLDVLGRQTQFVRDRQVQRLLFRNQQTPESLLQRIFLSYRLADVYLLTAGREATERVRASARRLLRRKFPQSSAEERVQLILKTEGRCLPQLVGVALGGRATALLCRRPLASTLLIRNLARWPSTPPPVLQHLARQPSVRRSPVLRAEILRHPNAPSHLKTDLRT